MAVAAHLYEPLDYQVVDLTKGETRTPEFLKLNPNGKMPVLVDGDFVLWESNAIMRYLCAKHPRAPFWPIDLKTRASADRWMDWQLSTIAEPMRIAFWGLIRTPPEKRDMAAIGKAAAEAGKLFGRLDGWLAGRRYVAGDHFTMGDIPVGCFVYRWYALEIERPELKNVRAWYERLTTRPAYARHVMIKPT